MSRTTKTIVVVRCGQLDRRKRHRRRITQQTLAPQFVAPLIDLRAGYIVLPSDICQEASLNSRL
jgi:hypothetical protein